MKQWQLLKPFVAGHMGKLLVTGLAGILSSMLAILLPITIGKFYELMFGTGGGRSILLAFLPESVFGSIPRFLGMFATLILLHMIASYAKRYLVASTGELLTYELRNRLFAHQLKLHTRIYEEKGVGKYLLRYSGDLKSIQNYLTKGIIGFTVDLIMVGLFLLVLASISSSLMLISLVGMVLMLIPLTGLNRRLHDTSTRRRNQKSSLLSFVSQRLQSIITIKAFNRETPERDRFLKRSGKTLNTDLDFHRISSLIHVLVPGMLYAMIAVMMMTIYWQKQNGILVNETSLLTAFLLIITMLPVLRRCLRVTVTWKLGMISLKKLQHVLDLPTEAESQDDLYLPEGQIRLEQVCIHFSDQSLLGPLSATWNPQSVHLVKGGTGSGKSTLVKTLLGIRDEFHGKIFLDDQEIREVAIKSLRKQVTIISQEYPLLGRTVFEAISYSRKPGKRKGADLMLQKVQRGLPAQVHLQLDDPIGRHGGTLSKGQELVLLVTRALLTRKPILLLDEPFQSIEPEFEAHLIRLIHRLRKKRNIILFVKHHEVPAMEFDSVTELSRLQEGEEAVVRSIDQKAS